MPTTNKRGHKIPLGTETTITRSTIFEAWGNSIRDVVPVANATARAQLVADLTSVGEGPTPAKPLYVYRHDAPGLHRIEYTTDGTVWVPASSVLTFASKAAADSWATANGALLTVGDRARVGALEYWWTGTAWMAARPVFFANRGSAQSLSPAGWWVISTAFAAPVVNDLGTWTGANGTLQVTHAGIYRVTGFAKLAAPQSTMSMQITQNSSAPDVNVIIESFVNSSVSSLNASALVSLNAGDVIRLLVFNSTATTVAGAQLSVELLQRT